ncbi:MAG TPA: hypothetical protein VL127_08345 [Bryobacteraceae bacterium]|nr:hypothetical protein [Bryobacteraceae bacterium]
MEERSADARGHLERLYIISETMPALCLLENSPDDVQLAVNRGIGHLLALAGTDIGQNILGRDRSYSAVAQNAINGSRPFALSLCGLRRYIRRAICGELFRCIFECQAGHSFALLFSRKFARFGLGHKFVFFSLGFAPVRCLQ